MPEPELFEARSCSVSSCCLLDPRVSFEGLPCGSIRSYTASSVQYVLYGGFCRRRTSIYGSLLFAMLGRAPQDEDQGQASILPQRIGGEKGSSNYLRRTWKL